MKQANIGVFVVLALASTSLVARPQAKDLKGPAIGKTQKSPRLRQVGNYPTMLNMTFPEFAAGYAEVIRRKMQESLESSTLVEPVTTVARLIFCSALPAHMDRPIPHRSAVADR